MDQSTGTSIDAQSLVSQLEQLTQADSRESLPSPRQVFVMGNILFRMHTNDVSDLFFAYQHLVDSLPEFHWEYILITFRKAASRLGTDLQDLITATESWCGLFTNAPRLCQMAYSKEWISTLAIIYDKFVLKDATTSQKHVLLATMSSLLLDGLFLPPGKAAIEEQLLEAIQSMEEYSTDCLGDLQDWQRQKEPFRRTLDSEIRKLAAKHTDESHQQQLEYIINMLESSRHRDTATSSILATTQKTKQSVTPVPKPISAADELERRIQQVKQILPHFGEGFIETALSLHQGNVENTISTLLSEDSPSYPTALRVMDRSLPRRRKERADEEAAQAAEARRLVKERVALEQKQEEAHYKALLYVQQQEQAEERKKAPSTHFSVDEYNDDYDDQYDDIDVKLGNIDEGMPDFEQVKLYNKLVRSEEAEDSFWQENRNTNRTPNESTGKNKNKKKANQDQDTSQDDGGGKQYRGPDKIKGGRVIGPDGKVVRKPGGAGVKKSPVNNTNNGQASGLKPTNGDAREKDSETTLAQQSNKGKPRTKPKSQNRVSRQRDRKQNAQGTFGVSS